MSDLKFTDTHNLVAFLLKPAKSEGFEQIVNFLNANPIKYALTINPTIYTSCINKFWDTIKVKTVNEEVQLHALVDRKKVIITESTIRRDLQLEYSEGTHCLPNATIFEQLTHMRYEKLSQKLTFYKAFFSPQWKYLIHTILQCLSAKTTAWNELSSTMASAIICLATNKKFNFSKYIFDNMVKNVDSMRKRKGFSGRVTPLFPTMMVQAQEEMGEGSANPTDPHHTPIITQPSTSKPHKKQKPRKPKRKDTEIPQSSGPTEPIVDEAANEENVPRHSNDPLFSGEDSLKLNDLMEIVESQEVREEKRVKNSQAQKTIQEVTLVDETQGRYGDDLVSDTTILDGEEVFAGQDVVDKEVSTADLVTTASEVVTTASVEVSAASATPVSAATTTTTTAITEVDLTLAQALAELRSAKPKIVDKGKDKMIEPEKPLKKKEQIRLDEELAFKLQAEEEEQARLAREKAKKVEEANIS
ncbi:hypothetical protein Tco_1304739 [Tanacetum coccineum]